MINLEIMFLSYQFIKRTRIILFGVFILLFFYACQSPNKEKQEVSRIEKLVVSGELNRAVILADSLKSTDSLKKKDLLFLDSIVEICHRIQLDFTLTESEVKQQLKQYYPSMDKSLFRQWESSGKLEVRQINGEKRYFKNAVSNLFRLDDPAKNRRIDLDGFQADSLKIFCANHTGKIIDQTKTSGDPVIPVRMKLTYTIQVKPNAVPSGKMIRCWMPFPREGNARQKNIRLIKSEPELAVIAPESDLQRSVYVEKRAVKDQPTAFQIVFEVETFGQYFDLKLGDVKTYNVESDIYKEFTSERAQQIVFTDKMKKLGDRIVAGETNPLLKVQKIYNWIDDSIRWASALEYSIIPNIPAYVVETCHGDCGMQTLLFMTLARSQGIPIKWQSGWMLHPGKVNLHDWCEVYYEGVGWVPLDQSFGLQSAEDVNVRNFYRSGIDSYRLIVNDDYGRELSPKKKYLRSEPYDFQRGEIEWEGGNLYFDQWTWHMDVEYL